MIEESLKKRGILILGLDTFAKKNIIQIRSLEEKGYIFTIVTNDLRLNSREIFEKQCFGRSRLIRVAGFLQKLITAWKLLQLDEYNHVEMYAAGRMNVFYLLMLKVLRKKYLMMERGDLGVMHEYDALTRAVMRLSYRFASAIIYKEPYMKELLQTFTRAPLFFIPNCVDAPPREWAGLLREERSVDFLWVNRFTPQRRALWLARSLHHEDLHETSALMLGFQDSEHIAEHVEKEQDSLLELKPKNLEIRGFSDPESHYRAAQFFCLPASLVFGNNSLLEAMSWGLVPIVTEAPGVELIVRDGINGIVTKFDEAAYQEGLVRAARMDDQEWERLSEAAKATVSREYAPATWSDRMAAAYGFIARQS